MKKTLFLIFSGAIAIFSIICICSAPIINNVLTDSENWKTHNCQHQSDELKNLEKINANKDTIKLQKKIRNQCNREKAMYGLEYSSLILDVTLGSICTILGLLHYFDVAKPFEKVSGIIGLATGVIGFIMTLVYICYSGYIFTNDVAFRKFDHSTFISSAIYKLNGDGVFAEKQSDGKFKCIFYDKDNVDAIYAKYNDLGKKQYNYEKKRHYDNSKYTDCELTLSSINCNPEGYFTLTSPNSCEKIYSSNPIDDFDNKYLFDRWITTFIFSCFICACCIGLAIFGFLLFKSDGSSL
jgi:hypothetical protein